MCDNRTDRDHEIQSKRPLESGGGNIAKVYANTEAAAPQIGRQSPTTSRILPYESTRGPDAVDLYELSGRIALPWQKALAYDILATRADGIWVHSSFGYAVPRRNGKGEVLIMIELFGLAAGLRVLHTAHLTSTEHSAWERICEILDRIGVKYTSIKAKGQEVIRLPNGGRIDFRTRTAKNAVGEGFDILIIDEAQEYQDDQQSALKYTVTSSPNPLTVMCGTPPTAHSSGTVFPKFRKAVLTGERERAGWAEWSVDDISDIWDAGLWYETNPSLGLTLTEQAVRDEMGDDVVDANIQRLGLWLKYDQRSVISRQTWQACQLDRLPTLKGRLSAGVKYARDGESVSLSIAARTEDGRIFVEAIQNRSVRDGTGWLLTFIEKLGDNLNKIVIDGDNGQAVLTDELKARKIRHYVYPTVKQVVTANAAFEDSLYKGNIVHMEQPGLGNVVSNCEKRAIGQHGGFGYSTINAMHDISLMDSMILAAWAVAEFKDRSTNKKSFDY